MAGVRTDCADPFRPVFQGMGGQGLMAHQAAVIQQARHLVEKVPAGGYFVL